MVRALEMLALFLAPSAVYLLWLIWAQRHPAPPGAWSGARAFWLVVAGLAAAIFGLFAFGLSAERQQGAYTPAHVENGKLVPGRFK
ncbi:MAG: hypothetical protein KGL46_01995 [Hyphomicrobiales bacterium]|nr:hypothetical protein [Hyphomicrobiales bacterium]